ncbi:hypothetical protein ABIS04_13325 [Shewanella sp. H8]|uniref:hypothetical protein n=1 Tax=Shewanella sp. H8 TaxID=3342676 RepID=UPI003314B123
MELIKIQKIVTLIAPYSLTVSLLYLLGFWGAFNINILEYIALTDVVKHALNPLVFSVLLLCLSTFIGSSLLPKNVMEVLPPGGGAHLLVAKYSRFSFSLIVILLFVAVIYFLLFSDSENRWYQAGFLAVLIIPLVIGESEFIKDEIPNRMLRFSIVYIMVSTILLSYGWGVNKAIDIKADQSIIIINDKKIQKSYIGRAGGYLFLWNNSLKEVEVVQSGEVKNLRFTIPEKKPVFNWFSEQNKT